MRYLISFLGLLLFCALAHSQSLVNCSPGVPCNPTTGPSQTGTGDPAWKAFGKINTDLSTLWPIAGTTTATGNGTTDDTAALQTAFSAGGEIKLNGSGMYLTNSLTLAANSFLDCQGGTIKIASGSNSTIITILGSNVRITNCVFDEGNIVLGSSNPQTASAIFVITTPALSNIVIDHSSFINIPTSSQLYHAVQMSGPITATLDSLYVPQSGGDELNFNGLGYYTITNCVLENSGDGGVAFNNSARGIASHNTFYKTNLGVGVGPMQTQGQFPLNGSLVISDNIFDTNYNGIEMGFFGSGTQGGPTNFTITGNLFINNSVQGIGYYGYQASQIVGGVISGNNFYRTGSSAYNGTTATRAQDIYIQDAAYIKIIGNNMRDNQATNSAIGISVGASGSPHGNTAIDVLQNTIESGGENATYNYGILLIDDDNAKISGNYTYQVNVGLESTDNSLSGVNRQESITDNFFAQTNIECIQLFNAVINTVVSGNSCIGGNSNLTGIDISPAVGFLTVTGNIFVLPTLTNYAIKLASSTTAYYYFIEGNITNGSPVLDGGPVGAVKNVSNNNPIGPVINVSDYGAKCDGSTDDHTAINNAIAYVGSLGNNSGYNYIGPTAHLVFPNTGKPCVITSPINLTSSSSGGQQLYGTGFTFDMTGAAILCKVGSGKACIDASGLGMATLLNLNIAGVSSSGVPDYGLTIGRVANNGVGADHLQIIHPTIGGNFNKAAFFNNQSETTLIEHANFSNASTNAYGAIWDGENHFNYQNIAVNGPFPQNTLLSFNENTCIQCIIQTSGVGSVPVWLGNTSRHKFVSLFTSANATAATTPVPGMILYCDSAYVRCNDLLEVDNHLENDGGAAAELNAMVLFAGTSATQSINGLQVRDNYTEQQGPLFKRDTAGTYGTAVTTVTINNANLNIDNQGNGSATWFDTPSAFTVNGHVFDGDNTWQMPGSFFGDLSVNGGVPTSGYTTIANLPTCNSTTKGGMYYVTNGQTTPAYLGTVSTTGTTVAPVFCNGSGWVYH